MLSFPVLFQHAATKRSNMRKFVMRGEARIKDNDIDKTTNKVVEIDSSSADEELSVGEPNPILLGVAQAKLSGIISVGLLGSQFAYNRSGGDPLAIDAVLGFPPGGPVVITACVVSGLYTLWRIQPVVQAVQASIAITDERRKQQERAQKEED